MKFRATVLVAGVALFLASGSARALPESTAREAETRFKHGVELFKEKDYMGALVELERANTLEPKYEMLYYIAESHNQLQDYASALRTFQKYLNEGGSRIPAARRADVDRELEALKKRVARLAVTTSEPGAEISVDDTEVGTTPLDEALLVSAGRRKITARVGTRPPVTETIDLPGGATKSITLVIPKDGIARIDVAAGHGKSTPLVPWAITGALAAGGVVMGIVALGASGDLKADLAKFPGDPDTIRSAREKTAAYALVADLFFASTAVAGGISVYLTLNRPKASDSAPRPNAPTAARLVVGPGTLGFASTF